MRQWKQPSNGVPAPALRQAADFAVDLDVDLRAVTPIYKGSANPDGIDADYPFRGPALRGQLRAWWRAVHETSQVDTLRRDEGHLFGTVFDGKRPIASKVSLGLGEQSSTAAHKSDLSRYSGGRFNYALWVDRGGESQGDERYHVDPKARLRVRLPHRDDLGPHDAVRLRKAIKALVLFGASGSRGRRGLGRLWSDDLLGSSVSDVDTLAQLLTELAPRAAARPWPSLAGASVAWLPGTFPKAGKAVDAALELFQSVRGMESVGGRQFDSRNRMRLAQRDWERVVKNEAPKGAFTAALGMPLPYRSSNGHLPGTTIVQPVGCDRLPSPVHLRPIPLPSGGWAAVMLCLQPWFTGRIEARNRRVGSQVGDLDPQAIDHLLVELKRKGCAVRKTGGAA